MSTARSVLVGTLDEAIQVVDGIAAEHVSLQCADPDRVADRVRHAGAIFIGPWSPIAAGDYASGTNHVLPTGGAARAWSGIGVETFGRWTELQRLTPAGVRHRADGVRHRCRGGPRGARRQRRGPRRARRSGLVDDDPVDLLRRPEPVEAYPAEPSDEELAARAGSRPARSCGPT